MINNFCLLLLIFALENYYLVIYALAILSLFWLNVVNLKSHFSLFDIVIRFIIFFFLECLVATFTSSSRIICIFLKVYSSNFHEFIVEKRLMRELKRFCYSLFQRSRLGRLIQLIIIVRSLFCLIVIRRIAFILITSKF